MNVLVNGEPNNFSETSLSVTELLGQLDLDHRSGIAVAVNYEVVPRSEWEEQRIDDGDEIEIVRATQGG